MSYSKKFNGLNKKTDRKFSELGERTDRVM